MRTDQKRRENLYAYFSDPKIDPMTQLEGLMWTLIIELPIAIILLRSQPIPKLVFVASSASLMTHPIAWYLSVLLSPQEYRVGFYVIEAAVVVAEASWYQIWLRIGWRYLAKVSLITNGVSMLLGGMLLNLFGTK